MSPHHYTNLARRIGVDCRYEWHKGRKQFRWNFYRCGQIVKSVKNHLCVITTAEKLVLDNGK